uniref:trafficking kinesin-binding protein 1-like isoform X2 n=1 Tax=Myxine glutinosa TaxID=7769 RepID=UPI00358F608B
MMQLLDDGLGIKCAECNAGLAALDSSEVHSKEICWDISDDEEVSWDKLYEVLHSENVCSSLKDCNDHDAVTHVSEQNDQRLQLAAHIGKFLLKKVKMLTEKSESLEESLAQTFEEVAQLRHDLSVKDELLTLYGNPIGGLGFPGNSPLSKSQSFDYEDFDVHNQGYYAIQEPSSNNLLQELSETKQCLAAEMAQAREEELRQHEEIQKLLKEVSKLWAEVAEYAAANEELIQQLEEAKQTQRQHVKEMEILQQKIAEYLKFLYEAQKETKTLQARLSPQASSLCQDHWPVFPMYSLAAEIEASVRTEMCKENENKHQHRDCQKRVFEAVRKLNKASQRQPLLSHCLDPGSPTLSHGNSLIVSGTRSPSNGSTWSCSNDSTNSYSLWMGNSRDCYSHNRPDSLSLEEALEWLDLRQGIQGLSQDVTSETDNPQLGSDWEGQSWPEGSIDEESWNTYSYSTPSFYSFLPRKLQIVKPFEGSSTMRQWQQLARPHLAAALVVRPGVLSRDSQVVNLHFEPPHQLADFEEDDLEDPSSGPGLTEECAYDRVEYLLSLLEKTVCSSAKKDQNSISSSTRGDDVMDFIPKTASCLMSSAQVNNEASLNLKMNLCEYEHSNRSYFGSRDGKGILSSVLNMLESPHQGAGFHTMDKLRDDVGQADTLKLPLCTLWMSLQSRTSFLRFPLACRSPEFFIMSQPAAYILRAGRYQQ